MRLSLLTALSLSLLSASTLAQTPANPFAGEIGEFQFRDEIRMPKRCGVVFVGSSSIRLWVGLEKDFPKLNIIQRGFGGSQISDSNLYFDTLVAKYQPAKVVFYAGENDLVAGENVDTVYQDFLTFMAKKDAALGATPVYFISSKPSPSRAALWPQQQALNAKVQALAATRPDLVYIDIVPIMLGKDGTVRRDIFVHDNLHMNEKGYALWRDVVGKALQREKASKSPTCHK